MSEESWREWYDKDPFPEIEPSLLNSHHIYKYGDRGCLIENFSADNLKTASYEVPLLGEAEYWILEDSPDGLRRTKESRVLLERGGTLTLPKNSIVFVYLRDAFRLPEYIAARFNLHIAYVHKGLLLGTGPLVDPGFKGRLLIPLHNLTENDYQLPVGEGLIWVEFTKVSRHWRWGHDVSKDFDDHFVPFPDRKTMRTPNDYFRNALVADTGVVSSIHSVLRDSRLAAEQARADAASARRTLRYWNIAGLIAIAALIWGGYDLVSSTNQVVLTAQQMIDCQCVPSESKEEVTDKIEEPSVTSPESRASDQDAIEDAPEEGQPETLSPDVP